MIRALFRILRPAPPQLPALTRNAIAYGKVRHLDDNHATKRAVIAQNEADLKTILSKGKSA